MKENKSKFIKMTKLEFDDYLLKTYIEAYREKNLPMSQTCMCWGADCNSGWYPLINSTFEKLQKIYELTGILTVFTQIKEKFGSLRLYYTTDASNITINVETSSIYYNIIGDIITHAENRSCHICDICGCSIDETITIGGWIYGTCYDCLKTQLKDREGIVEILEASKKRRELIEDIKFSLYGQGIEKLEGIVKIIYNEKDNIQNP